MWVSPSSIVDGSLKVPERNLDIQFHPALRRSTCDFTCMKMWGKIETLTKDTQASDSEIRKLLSQYIEQKNKV